MPRSGWRSLLTPTELAQHNSGKLAKRLTVRPSSPLNQPQKAKRKRKAVPAEYQGIDRALATRSQLLRHANYTPPKQRRDPIPSVLVGPPGDPLLHKLQRDAEQHLNSSDCQMRLENYRRTKSAPQFSNAEAWQSIDEARRFATHDARAALSRSSLFTAREFPARNCKTRGKQVRRHNLPDGTIVYLLRTAPLIPIGHVTPGRALKAALGRFTRTSLNQTIVERDDYDGEIQESGELYHDVIAPTQPVEPEINKRRKRAYVPVADREMLSVVRLRNKARSDGKALTDRDIAQRLQISASRVKQHRVEAELKWADYTGGTSRLGTTAKRVPLKPSYLQDQQTVAQESMTEVSTNREVSNSGIKHSRTGHSNFLPAVQSQNSKITAIPAPKVSISGFDAVSAKRNSKNRISRKPEVSYVQQ